MSKSRKTWLWPAAGIALAALVLILSQAQRVKATLSPPPGPRQAGDVWMADLGGKTTMAMVWCPPGKFLMGSPVTETGRIENEPQHEVTLTEGFWIGKYEVTQGQWLKINVGGMWNYAHQLQLEKVIRWKLWKWEIPVWRIDYRNRPVDWVSWNQCQYFQGGFRLPSEVEWEYACRAGSTGPFASRSLGWMGWCRANSGGKSHRVGGKSANAWGLHDMHGNVREWCQDKYVDDVTAPVDKSDPHLNADYTPIRSKPDIMVIPEVDFRKGTSLREIARSLKRTSKDYDPDGGQGINFSIEGQVAAGPNSGKPLEEETIDVDLLGSELPLDYVLKKLVAGCHSPIHYDIDINTIVFRSGPREKPSRIPLLVDISKCVVRGGGSADAPALCRAAFRMGFESNYEGPFLGCRVVFAPDDNVRFAH
jgi:formylglycine-generating enzyme required for sulfatase activity